MARWRFTYDHKGEDGSSIREQLTALWKATKRKPELLNTEPKLHQMGQKIYAWFGQVQRTRGGGFGPAPLTHQEIRAWYQNMRIRPRPEPWEIELILMLGDIQLEVWAERSKEEKGDKDK